MFAFELIMIEEQYLSVSRLQNNTYIRIYIYIKVIQEIINNFCRRAIILSLYID
jgi:hypothetical protein